VSTKVDRRTVDLSSYPDLVVVYLGMKVNTITGIKTLLGFGPKISKAAAAAPDGLLLHETMIYSLFPPHVGMREYWRDLESLERWTHSDPHKQWWKAFLRDSGGTGFWHESYFMRGGMEAIYADINVPLGLSVFAPVHSARGPMFSARTRMKAGGPEISPPVNEAELYDSKP
jgi:hypothetical protein